MTHTYQVWTCHKCGQSIEADKIGVWADPAPHAAGGGGLAPYHRECAPIVFQGPSFDNKAKHFTEAANLVLSVRDDTVMSKYATQAECRAAMDALWKAAEALQTVARLKT